MPKAPIMQSSFLDTLNLTWCMALCSMQLTEHRKWNWTSGSEPQKNGGACNVVFDLLSCHTVGVPRSTR